MKTKATIVKADYGDMFKTQAYALTGRKAGKTVAAKKASARKSTRGMVEKRTGERYASKSAMRSHEKSEPKSQRMKEYGPKGRGR